MDKYLWEIVKILYWVSQDDKELKKYIIELFWPSFECEQAERNKNQTVRIIKEQVMEAIDNLKADYKQRDILSFEEKLTAANTCRAVKQVIGEVLGE